MKIENKMHLNVQMNHLHTSVCFKALLAATLWIAAILLDGLPI